MKIYWQEIDDWREQRGMDKAELARRSGLSERSIYNGIRNNAQLKGGSITAMRQIFMAEFQKREGAA